MKLQQLRFLVAVAESGLNVSLAARQLYTSQPGVSKQLRQLEGELGFPLFERRGRALVKLTDKGRQVLTHAQAVMREVQAVKSLIADPRRQSNKLAVVATPLQARHALPWVIEDFSRRQPGVNLQIHQSSGSDAINRVRNGEAQFAISEARPEQIDGLLVLPWYRWRYRLLAPPGYDVGGLNDIQSLAAQPLIVCAADEEGLRRVKQVFAERGVTPNITCTSDDPDVVQAQVRMGRGIGIVPEMVIGDETTATLVQSDERLLPRATTWVVLRRDLIMQSHLRDFLTLLAPHLITAVSEQQGRIGAPPAIATQPPSLLAAEESP
ncbi:MAG: HTH-type transcriptional regulator CysB [Wenzhouxiangellaceae bacterium]